MGELKRLDQALFLQLTKRSLLGDLKAPLQRAQRTAVVIEALNLAHICFRHG